MEDPLALVKIIQGSKFRSSGLLDILLDPGTQMRQLYNALVSGEVRNDEDALRELPTLGNSSTSLAILKSKLKDRLNEALVFIEFTNPEPNDRQKAYLECSKKWASTIVLLSRDYRDLAIQRLEQLLRYTQRFEFTEMTIDILQVLRLHSGMLYGNEQHFHKYNMLIEQHVEMRNKEELAEASYINLMVNFVNSKSDKLELAEQAMIRFQEIEPWLLKYDTYRLHLFGRMLQIAIYDNQNDYQQVIRLCEEAIAFFDSKTYKSYNALQVFYYSLLTGYINLRQYSHSRIVANQYQDIFQNGSYNWFKWQELHFLVELQDGKYKDAFAIWLQATANPKYNELPSSLAESWKIFEAYLLFLIRCGSLKEDKHRKKFRVAKNWNEIHVASRDKAGMNIPILVIRFLLNLADGEYGQCLDRLEGMAKYRTRYLKLATAGRSHYFFRMLELIPKNNFDFEAIQLYATPFLEQLMAISSEAVNQNFEVEIIPYETLWQMTLSLLKDLSSTRQLEQ